MFWVKATRRAGSAAARGWRTNPVNGFSHERQRIATGRIHTLETRSEKRPNVKCNPPAVKRLRFQNTPGPPLGLTALFGGIVVCSSQKMPGTSRYRTSCAYVLSPCNSNSNNRSSKIVRRMNVAANPKIGITASQDPNATPPLSIANKVAV